MARMFFKSFLFVYLNCERQQAEKSEVRLPDAKTQKSSLA
jgi:hypothetical protein